MSDNITGTASNETTYSDSSGNIFNMYSTRAQSLDHDNVENWKDGANSILVFVSFHAPITVDKTSQASPFPDWSFRFYGRYLYRHQLSELAPRSQRRHPVPPRTDIPTTFQCQCQRLHSHRDSAHPNTLLSLRFCGIR
jgi:hypothetical protein